MTEPHENDVRQRLFELLIEHFPTSKFREEKAKIRHAARIQKHAGRIADAWFSGEAIEHFLKSDRPAKNDKDALAMSASHVQNAAKRLNKVGFFGGKALETYARDFKKRWENIPWEPVVDAPSASSEFASILTEIADALAVAASNVDEKALPLASALDGTTEWPKGGAPVKGAARDVVDEAANAFEELAGRKAGRVNQDGKKSGHFLELVEAIFEILGCDAKPDNIIKEVLKRRQAMEKTPEDD